MIKGGLLLVDKPEGVSSYAVVERVRRTLGRGLPGRRGRRAPGTTPGAPRFRVGHAGTLDPLATGLLVVMLGRASRLSPFLLGMDKSYLATIRFGTATDTLDATGTVVATAPPPRDPASVIAVLPQFTGAIMQVPPVYSALKRDGEPLYKSARAGLEVEEPAARPIVIDRLAVADVRWLRPDPEIDLDVSCASGTYVRSLARDVALAVGSVGHLTALRRTRVGPFLVDDAFVGVMEADADQLAGAMIPLAESLPHLPMARLDAAEAVSVRNGRQPDAGWLARATTEAGQLVRLVGTDGDLVAVAMVDPETGLGRLVCVLPAIGESASCE